MDFFDFIPIVPPRFPGEPSKGRSAGENVTGALGTLVFPLANFALVLIAGLWKHPILAVFGMPAIFTAATFMLGRALGASTRWTVQACFGCALACFVAGGIAFLMGVLASFYSGF